MPTFMLRHKGTIIAHGVIPFVAFYGAMQVPNNLFSKPCVIHNTIVIILRGLEPLWYQQGALHGLFQLSPDLMIKIKF